MPEVTLTSELQPINDENVFIDDGRETMIKIDHVTMEFNMASEQLNSLKEYAIAIAKRKLYFEKFVALDDISFEVKKGDVFGILGTNGSGKSTLLKIIAGVLQPTKGSCEINGNIAPLIELGAGFDMELSARENIYLNGSLLGYSKAFIEDHFNDIVEFAEIEKFLDMPMKNYSSGMVARIAFAIATVIVPEILIVDEVLSVGDFMFQQKCENRINELIEKHGVTVLIVSHSNDQIERLCNKAIWIEKGHTRIIGDAEQVCNAYRVLGGRTGSAASEHVIFNALQQMRKCENSIVVHKVKGTSHYQIAANAALEGWKNGATNIILVPDNAHVFSIAASGLSGALDAPILPYNENEPSEEIVLLIHKLNPENIYIIGHSDMVSQEVKTITLKFPNVNVLPICCPDGCAGILEALLSFGLENNIWRSEVAFLGHFDDINECYALSALAYKYHYPFLVIGSKESCMDSKIINLLNKAGIKYLSTFLTTTKHSYAKSAEEAGFVLNELGLRDAISNANIAQVIYKNMNPDPLNVCIAPGHRAYWQDLIALPSYCGKKDQVPIIVNTDILDETAAMISFFKRNHVDYADIFGSDAISEIYIKLLSN